MQIESAVKWNVILALVLGLCLPSVGHAEEAPLGGGQPNGPVIQETVPLPVAEDLAENGQPLTHEQQVAVQVMNQPSPQDPPKDDGKDKDGEGKPATVPPEIQTLIDAYLDLFGIQVPFGTIGTATGPDDKPVVITGRDVTTPISPEGAETIAGQVHDGIRSQIAGSDLTLIQKVGLGAALNNINAGIDKIMDDPDLDAGTRIVVVIGSDGTVTYRDQDGNILSTTTVPKGTVGLIIRVFGFETINLDPPAKDGDDSPPE